LPSSSWKEQKLNVAKFFRWHGASSTPCGCWIVLPDGAHVVWGKGGFCSTGLELLMRGLRPLAGGTRGAFLLGIAGLGVRDRAGCKRKGYPDSLMPRTHWC
jgi:hypothetical protein